MSISLFVCLDIRLSSSCVSVCFWQWIVKPRKDKTCGTGMSLERQEKRDNRVWCQMIIALPCKILRKCDTGSDVYKEKKMETWSIFRGRVKITLDAAYLIALAIKILRLARSFVFQNNSNASLFHATL